MNVGTDVYFVWSETRKVDDLIEDLSSLLSLEGCIRTGIGRCWTHDTFGSFSLTAPDAVSERVNSICMCFDCELLPELNDPGFERPELPPKAIYHLIKRLFASSGSDCCFAATQSDGVKYFNFSDPLVSRIFKFTKSGPQKLVRPYEENRAVAFSDLIRDSNTRQPAWMVHLNGHLRF